MNTDRILLTGATGFVGQQVRRCLPANAEIHCTSRSLNSGDEAVGWHVIDLRNPNACVDLIAEVRPDILIHCAWNTSHGEFWQAEDNENWLEASKALFSAFVVAGGRRIVGCGSCAEYSRTSDVPHREDEPIEPITPTSRYGRCKLALLHHLETLNVSYSWARIFLAYGECEYRRRLIPSVLLALLAGEPALCSSGNQVRDFIDVRDLGEALAKLAGTEMQGVVNLGSGERTKLGEVVQMLGVATGRTELVRLGALPNRPGEDPILIPHVGRQTEELAFVPRIALDQGLRDAAKFWSTKI